MVLLIIYQWCLFSVTYKPLLRSYPLITLQGSALYSTTLTSGVYDILNQRRAHPRPPPLPRNTEKHPEERTKQEKENPSIYLVFNTCSCLIFTPPATQMSPRTIFNQELSSRDKDNTSTLWQLVSG